MTGDGGSYDGLVAAHLGAADQTRPVADDAPAWLFYTSGTTGRSKGAVLTHGNLTFVAVSWCADLYPLAPRRTSSCTARRCRMARASTRWRRWRGAPRTS